MSSAAALPNHGLLWSGLLETSPRSHYWGFPLAPRYQFMYMKVEVKMIVQASYPGEGKIEENPC